MNICRPRAKAGTTALTGMALVTLVLLGGCGNAPVTPGPSATVSRASTTPTGLAPSDAMKLTELSAGRTAQIRRGDRVVLTLHNTYWRIAPPDGRILTQIGAQSVKPDPRGTCLPGIGCGTVQAVFTATASGSTKITASRTSCGEALPCPPAQGSFIVHLVVR
jgi:hypothetical protein